MSFIENVKSKYTAKRMNNIKQLYMSVNNERGAIKSNSSSPEIFAVNKKTSLRSLPTMLSIGKNIEYTFKSLKNNPEFPKITASNDFINEFEDRAKSMGIKSIGYTNVIPKVIFQDKAVLYGNVIVLTKELDKNAVNNEFPGKTAIDLRIYDEFGKKTNELADYLRENGFGAHASHPAMGLVTYPTLAQHAGLGWRGKNNLLITPELGPRQKISAIFTSIENLPVKSENEHEWVADYCNTCKKCLKKCPEKAILEIESHNGPNGTKLVSELCKGCNESCTICMKNCPFNIREYTVIKSRFKRYHQEQ